jgi:hypothetical protein
MGPVKQRRRAADLNRRATPLGRATGYLVQNGVRPIADLMPLTIICLNCACPLKPEPSVKARASWPSVVSQARPPS